MVDLTAHTAVTLPTLRGGRRETRAPFDAIFGTTHQGHVRERNEDHYLVVHTEHRMTVGPSSLASEGDSIAARATLLVVADGMGGHADGELASAVTVDTIAAYAARVMPAAADPELTEMVHQGFQAAALACQRKLREVAERKGASNEMGTTLTALYAHDGTCDLAHVGDSRAYLCRSGQLYRLTHDHTIGAAMGERAKDLAPQFTSALANAIGGNIDEPKVESLRFELYPGDRLLLCSDGLTRYLDDPRLAQHLAVHGAPETIARAMVEEVLATEARDNVTVIVADVGAAASEMPAVQG